METILPRIAAGLIYAIYKGDSIDAAPTPIPATIRQKTSMLWLGAHPISTEESMNMAAAMVNGNFLPSLSVAYPVIRVPIIHPRYSELPVQPSCASDKP